MAETIALAFSTDQVRRLTRLSVRQLRYWDTTEFFSPEYAPGYSYGVFSRVYSFRDVVGLYTIGLLRKRYKFPLQKLRQVGAYLRAHHETPWAGLALFVAGHDIVFRDPENPHLFISARERAGQTVLPIEMHAIARHVEGRAERLKKRLPGQIGRVERRRHVVHNSPVLAGTRVPTAAVWNLYKAGYDTQAILREYPRLRLRDVEVAILYEGQRLKKRA